MDRHSTWIPFRLKSWTWLEKFEDGVTLFHVSNTREDIKGPEIIPCIGPIPIVIPFFILSCRTSQGMKKLWYLKVSKVFTIYEVYKVSLECPTGKIVFEWLFICKLKIWFELDVFRKCTDGIGWRRSLQATFQRRCIGYRYPSDKITIQRIKY